MPRRNRRAKPPPPVVFDPRRAERAACATKERYDSEAEGAITIDPANPNRMFVLSNDAQGGLFAAYSTNAGKNWVTR